MVNNMKFNEFIGTRKDLQKSLYCMAKCSECGKWVQIRWDLAQNKDLNADNFVCNHCIHSKVAKKNFHSEGVQEKVAHSRYNRCDENRYHQKNGKYEHRAIMEEHLGRKLSSDEIVHHIDGNKHNNDILNLTIMTRAEHTRWHQQHRKIKITIEV